MTSMTSSAASTSAASSVSMDQKEPPEGWARNAMNLIMVNRFHDAARLCAAKFDTNPRLAVLHAHLSFLKAASSEGEQELADALATAWRAEKLGRTQIGSNVARTSIEGRLASADGHLLGSLIQFTQQSYVKCAWNMRKSWKAYQAAIADINKYTGIEKEELQGWAYFGSGLFNLLVSILPPSVVRVAELIGFSGDRATGIAQLKASQTSTSFMAPFSGLMLLNYYVTISVFTGEQSEAMLVEADTLCNWGLRNFPDGMFWCTMESRYFRCRTELRRAIEVAENAVRHSTELPAVAILIHYQKGWCAFFLLEWRESALYFDHLLHQQDTPITGGAVTTTQLTPAQAPTIEGAASTPAPSSLPTTSSTPTMSADALSQSTTPTPSAAIPSSTPSTTPSSISTTSTMGVEEKKENDAEIDRQLAAKRRINVSRASVQAFYAYHVGVCYAAAGDWRRAMFYFRSVPTWLIKDKMRPMDEYAKRKAEQWVSVKKPRTCDALLDAFELVHAWAGFAQMAAPQLAAALELLIAAGRTEGTPERTWKLEGLARYHLFVGAIYKTQGRLDGATTCLSAILKVEDGIARDARAKQNGVLAFTYHDLAAIYIDQKLWQRAAAAHKRAVSFEDYELYKAVHVRLHALRALITKGSNGTV